MSQAHIRDVLAVSKEDFKEGKVSTQTLCGLDDPKMNTLTFADPVQIVKRAVKNYCEKCRNKWVAEMESDSKQKKAYFKFRNMIHNANNFSRFRR